MLIAIIVTKEEMVSLSSFLLFFLLRYECQLTYFDGGAP